ncbi:MAG: efflux RND transporter periplasmic adaptor subunit [Gammaproteobacteria bacterium]|nr:efflux RND transporter periplasmic adaptor subunit [Gammaproteobacteria bacterium]
MMNRNALVRSIPLLCLTTLLPTLVQADEFDASVQWARRVELSTPVSGVVVEVPAHTGERVRQDQVLLRLDSKVRAANLEQAKAQLARQARLRSEAQRELDRSQELFNATLLSEHEMELARIGADSAEAELQKAKAVLAQAESDLKYSDVRAPFDAVVLQRFAEVGQTVATQLQVTPLFVVAQADVMIARTTATLAQLRALKAEQAVTVKVGGRSYEGHITQLGAEPVPKRDESRYAVEVTFATKGAALRAGEVAKIVVP